MRGAMWSLLVAVPLAIFYFAYYAAMRRGADPDDPRPLVGQIFTAVTSVSPVTLAWGVAAGLVSMSKRRSGLGKS